MTNGTIFPMLAQVPLCNDWMELHLSIPDYGESLGKCPKGFHLWNYAIAKRALNLNFRLSLCTGDTMFSIFATYFLALVSAD